MRHFIFGFLFFFSLQQVSVAQMPQWSSVAIPGDSLSPFALTFFDSLHGYLGVTQISKIIDTNSNQTLTHSFYFETSDGGKNWKKLTDSNISGPGIGDYNPPVLFASLNSRYFFNSDPPFFHPYGAIIHSSDAGISWQIPFYNQNLELYPLQIFPGNTLLAYDKSYTGKLYKSYNGGKSYTPFVDSTYQFTIHNVGKDPHYTSFGIIDSSFGGRLSFDNSELMHWTIAINRSASAHILHPPTDPMGLQTLLSEDYGNSWKTYNTQIPGEDTLSRIGGTLQYIKGTSNLYYFTGQLSEGFRDYGSQLSTADYGDPMFGINWLYSTDYGKSWEFQYSYSSRRRAFEAVRQSEVWITARTANSKHTWDPASIIARTTDNGLTWEEDAKTLTNDANNDGRIMTFSDPRHGWIVAKNGDSALGGRVNIFRYDASEQPINSVETQTEFTQKYLKIYPNPSWDQVRLQLGNPRTVLKVEFFDFMGRQDYPPYHLEGNEVAVDIKNLSPATYIARVTYLYKGWTSDFTLPLVVQH